MKSGLCAGLCAGVSAVQAGSRGGIMPRSSLSPGRRAAEVARRRPALIPLPAAAVIEAAKGRRAVPAGMQTQQMEKACPKQSIP